MCDSTPAAFDCPKCGRTLPIEHKAKSQNQCKDCWADYMRGWYQRQSEERKQAWRARVANYREANPTAVLATRLKTHFANPSKVSARRCVEAAIAAGSLVRSKSCGSCGTTQSAMSDGRAYIQAHHHDHINEPLEVSWLCPKCHYRADAILRKSRRS